MSIFVYIFWLFLGICILLHICTYRSYELNSNYHDFHTLQRSYLGGYLLATAGDWLQGPHLYALYQSYDMTKHQIELLFVVGFSSGLIFGTTIGSFADKLGRRLNCMLYGMFYIFCCLSKHSANFYILACGCILGGVATSILFSAFESWLIHDFNRRNIDKNLLGNIFSSSVLANSIVAILMGLVAQLAVDTFGFRAPFDLAACVFMLMIITIRCSWAENYGSQDTPVYISLQNAFQLINNDHKVLCLGMIQSLFESSMYVFVLEWTPSLNSAHNPTEPQLFLPHGLIFSVFMLSIMIGSYIFKILLLHKPVESFMRFVLGIAAVALFLPVLFPLHQIIVFGAFNTFEVCVGIIWPSIGTLRGKYLKDSTRATVMNIFRIPLNVIVILILVSNLPRNVIFVSCSVSLIMASIFQHWLHSLCQEHSDPSLALKYPETV